MATLWLGLKYITNNRTSSLASMARSSASCAIANASFKAWAMSEYLCDALTALLANSMSVRSFSSSSACLRSSSERFCAIFTDGVSLSMVWERLAILSVTWSMRSSKRGKLPLKAYRKIVQYTWVYKTLKSRDINATFSKFSTLRTWKEICSD